MDDVLAYIESHMEDTIARLQAFCRQPSIAAQGVGMAEMAELVRVHAGRRPAPRSSWCPGRLSRRQWGAFAGAGSKTLMFYNHYDVQPPEPLDLWDSPPFAAEIRDGHLYARGVADNKGNLVARLAAVEAWLAVRGELPLNVLFVVEGEEEIGSPNLGRFAEENIATSCGPMAASGSRATRTPRTGCEISLGVKGILAVDLRVADANRDLHSANAAIVESPAWRLIWALNSLKGPDERILHPRLLRRRAPARRPRSGHARRLGL